jgi:hypothetical protein
MYCLSAETGKERWFTSAVSKFISASPTRLYTTDESGRLMILDRASGAHLDLLPTELIPIKVVNIQTDRVFLATTTGLLQCLREVDLVKPHLHAIAPEPGPAGPPAARAPAAAAAPAEAADEMPADAAAAADDPFGAEAQP